MKSKSNNKVKKNTVSDTVLALLEGKNGWYSGEDLARMLGISRAAVAKHVAVLRRFGHVIESVTNRGYLLKFRYEPTDYELVKPHLRSKVMGRVGWRAFEETVSTNTEAITWALTGGEEGSVVTAERQTSGKGRKGRDWFSSPHSLQFSLVLRPKSRTDSLDAVTLAALDALTAAVVSVANLKPKIKLPNDLYLDGKKIAGVLLEAGSRAGEPDWLAVGVGCNVNTLPDEFPPSLADKVTSLYQVSGTAVGKNLLLAEFLGNFEKRLREVRRR